MGNSSNTKFIKENYGVYIGRNPKDRIVRNPYIADKILPNEPIKGVDTIWKAFEHSCINYPNNNFLGSRLKQNSGNLSDYEWNTYSECKEIVINISSAIQYLKLSPSLNFDNYRTDIDTLKQEFKFLGIFCKNREEWILFDLACHSLSITIIPIYDTLGPDVLSYILNQTSLSTLVIDFENLDKLKTTLEKNVISSLKNIVILGNIKEESNDKLKDFKFLKIYYFSEILEIGKKNIKIFELNECTKKTISTFCYTSGTTGTPKAAMLSHGSILANCAAMLYSDVKIKSEDVYLSYLPLAHVLERVFIVACILNSASIGFYQGEYTKITEDAKLLKPTIFIGVPRVYQRISMKIKEKFEKLNMINKLLAKTAIYIKTKNYNIDGSLTHKIYDKLIFNKIKENLGGKVRFLASGSAPLNKELKSFIQICFCCPLIEGYGSTECSGAATFTKFNDYYSNSVGGITCSMELKLKQNDSFKDNDNCGEILLRGPSIFSGYFLDKEKTLEVLDSEGWLHTGDIGKLNCDLSLSIIDRVRNVFKLSNGEYVAPEKIENCLINNLYVSQIYIYGDSSKDYIVAIIVPNIENCMEYLKLHYNENDLQTNLENILNKSNFKSYLLKDLNVYGRNHGLNGFEVVKNIHLTIDPFSIENDMLTPSMKIKRNKIKDFFKEIIYKLYDDNEQSLLTK